MFQVRRSSERGYFDHGWLKTFHTFSFGDFHDAAHHHFRALRVINEDRVAPGHGFDMHGHRDMEIVTYVLSGSLAHRDNLGHGSTIAAGELQRMTAGRGILHSESNPSLTEEVHLYQIWILPEQRGLDPGYEQKKFPAAERKNRWQTVASPGGAGDSLVIHQDARIRLAEVAATETLDVPLQIGRYAWLQVLRGSVQLGEHQLQAGDGVAVSDESTFDVQALAASELLLFDLS